MNQVSLTVRSSVLIGLLLAQGCQTTHIAAPSAATGAIVAGAGNSQLVSNNTGSLVANNTGSLISNNAGGFTGIVRGPAAGLISNNAGGLISNNAGGLISNNAGGLISNNAGGFRVLDLTALTTPVSGAKVGVYDQKGTLLSDTVTTGADGAYQVAAVKSSGPIVYLQAAFTQEGQDVVLVSAVAAPRGAGSTQVAIDPASTLVSKKVADVVRQGAVTDDQVNPDLIAQIAQKIAPQLDAQTIVAASILTEQASSGVFDGLLRSKPDLRHGIQTLTDGVGPAAGTMISIAPTAVGSPTPAPGTLPAGRSVSVTTVAGSGSAGTADGAASIASFNTPYGLAMDAAKNVYVADAGNHRIRKIAADGTTTTLAGSSVGYRDGGRETALFNNPTGVALDAAGNLYVADTGNNRVRKIATNGVVTTLAGGNAAGYADGTGAAAAFNAPTDLAVDGAGNLYVCDSSNHSIRMVAPSGAVTTLAGNGTPGYANGTGALARFNSPASITFDGANTLYVADLLNYRIRTVSLTGQVGLLAGNGAVTAKDGPSAQASFIHPSGVTVDPQGNVYVAEAWSQGIREVTPAGNVLTLTWSDPDGAIARFNGPTRLISDGASGLFVADNFNHRIRHVQ